ECDYTGSMRCSDGIKWLCGAATAVAVAICALAIVRADDTDGSAADQSVPATVMARPGKLLFADDFSRVEVGDAWKTSVRSYSIENGVFITGQRPEATHPAVCRVHVPLKDTAVDFQFKFDSGTQLTLVFNDADYQGSHAGHIC